MRSGRCSKCGSQRIGRFENVLDPITRNTDERRIGNKEFRRLSATVQKKGYLGGGTPIAAEVEALVCTECGYFEEYVKDPKNVAWDQLPMFSWYKG